MIGEWKCRNEVENGMRICVGATEENVESNYMVNYSPFAFS